MPASDPHACPFRMTTLSLQGPAASAAAAATAPSPHSARGSAAAEGITNPGRLLGLGLALGIGAEVFGAPGPTLDGSAAAMATDLSPLSPLLSKSQLRKLQRRASVSGTPASAVPGVAGTAAAASGGGKQQHQQPGRRGKPGRSKQERRARGGGVFALDAAKAGVPAAGPSSDEDAWRQQQQLGLGGGAGGLRSLDSDDGGNSGGKALVSGDYGHFERHTTGIGSKLLAKWGFAGEGAGLGRGQQGRAEPLQAVRRAKGLGLGAER